MVFAITLAWSLCAPLPQVDPGEGVHSGPGACYRNPCTCGGGGGGGGNYDYYDYEAERLAAEAARKEAERRRKEEELRRREAETKQREETLRIAREKGVLEEERIREEQKRSEERSRDRRLTAEMIESLRTRLTDIEAPTSALEFQGNGLQFISSAAPRKKATEVPVPREEGWVAEGRKGHRILASVTMALERQGIEPALRLKLEELGRVATQLSRVEQAIHLLNLRNADRQALLQALEGQTTEDREEFVESTRDILTKLCLEARGQLNNGTLRDTAEGLAQVQSKIDRTQQMLDLLAAGGDRSKTFEALVQITKEWSAEFDWLPALSTISRAAELESFARIGVGLVKREALSRLVRGEGQMTEEDLRRITLELLPRHRDLSDRIDAIRKDPGVKKAIGS